MHSISSRCWLTAPRRLTGRAAELFSSGSVTTGFGGGAGGGPAPRPGPPRAELPYDAWRLSEGEPAVPTRRLELDGRTALHG